MHCEVVSTVQVAQAGFKIFESLSKKLRGQQKNNITPITFLYIVRIPAPMFAAMVWGILFLCMNL